MLCWHRTALAGPIVINSVVDDSKDPAIKLQRWAIRKLAKSVPELWGSNTQGTSWKLDLAGANVEAIPGFLVPFESTVQQMTALEPATWQRALAEILKHQKLSITEEALRIIADRLHRTYPIAVRELLKRDSHAFTALQLMFFRTILDRLPNIPKAENASDQSALDTAITKIAEYAKQQHLESSHRFKKWLITLDDAARTRHQQ